jgi:hypothetical protein
MTHYGSLLGIVLPFLSVANHHPGDNLEAVQINVQHQAKKLRVIRDNAATQNQMLLQNYVGLYAGCCHHGVPQQLPHWQID